MPQQASLLFVCLIPLFLWGAVVFRGMGVIQSVSMNYHMKIVFKQYSLLSHVKFGYSNIYIFFWGVEIFPHGNN